jgi:hypothetical protein
MDWDKLPPRRIEECRHRLVDAPEASPGGAVCNLVVQAGVPREHCGVQRDTCSACLRQFPPAPNRWNTVVASLIYTRSRRALASASLAPDDGARLAQLEDRAADHLLFSGNPLPQACPNHDRKPLADSLGAVLPSRKRSRRRVKAWAVGVVSSPRRQPTLDITLDSLIRAGWDRPHLFLDGTVRIPERFAGLPGVLREPHVGCWPNYYLALAELLMRHPEADAYLLAEDDALFYDGEVLREHLEEMLWPDRRPCLVSLYCPSLNSARSFGWHSLRPGWSLGALAFIFPRCLAQGFLLDQGVCDHRWGRWQESDGGLAHSDIVIGLWAQRQRVRIWYPTPSLVQHIGVTSTLALYLQATGERRADCWIGDYVPFPLPRTPTQGCSPAPPSRQG